jgi:putative N6-adenine-specific DNA methylase
MAPPLSAFAVTAPGIAPLAAAELRALGIAPGALDPGGVAFAATRAQLYEANLSLRTVSRVVVRLAEFEARSFQELERQARRVPWETIVHAGQPVRLRVTCRKSRLYHSDAVAQRVIAAIAHRLGAPVPVDVLAREDADDDAESATSGQLPQLFTVRFVHDHCTISADSSGALLHLRGYRQAVGKAPLRETLAAAMLLASGYTGEAPLLDPLCGSGTIAIEAALIARRLAPGRSRPFAFMDWPGFDRVAWKTLSERAEERALPRSPVPIVASDRDAGAAEATRANAERAGVSADVDVSCRPLSAVALPAGGPGWLVTNPPYGVRVGDPAALRNLYSTLGRVAREPLASWTVALLSADVRLERQLGLAMEPALNTSNGGIPVRLLVRRGVVPG